MVATAPPLIAATTLSSPNPNPSTSELLHQNSDDLQVILPSHDFKHDGLVYNISVQVEGPTSPMSFQIWRESVKGVYSLHWYITSSGHPFAVERVGNEMRFHDVLGVPVNRGDVIGIYISPSLSPMKMVYEEKTNSGFDGESVYYMKNATKHFCSLSTCDPNVKSLRNIFPFVGITSKCTCKAVLLTNSYRSYCILRKVRLC